MLITLFLTILACACWIAFGLLLKAQSNTDSIGILAILALFGAAQFSSLSAHREFGFHTGLTFNVLFVGPLLLIILGIFLSDRKRQPR